MGNTKWNLLLLATASTRTPRGTGVRRAAQGAQAQPSTRTGSPREPGVHPCHRQHAVTGQCSAFWSGSPGHPSSGHPVRPAGAPQAVVSPTISAALAICVRDPKRRCTPEHPALSPSPLPQEIAFRTQIKFRE